MNEQIKQKIFDKIAEYDRIFLFRHVRGDGDCVGAAKGLQAMIRLTWPEKEVYLIDPDEPEQVAFMGHNDAPVADSLYEGALAIILDTAVESRISVDKYKLCKEQIKIDHHIPVENYGDLYWVEEDRSSCCEMIVNFYETFRDTLKIDAQAATYLYAGMVTDSGRFRYDTVDGNTLRAAATLLDVGIDTQRLFAQLYLEEPESLKFRSYVYDHMTVTENGVAYLYIDIATREQFGLTMEQASLAVDYMDSIKGVLSWMIFQEVGDEKNTIRVRMRSRFVPINEVAQRYNGGGHALACGASVYTREAMDALVRDTDKAVKCYKETHTDWL